MSEVCVNICVLIVYTAFGLLSAYLLFWLIRVFTSHDFCMTCGKLKGLHKGCPKCEKVSRGKDGM